MSVRTLLQPQSAQEQFSHPQTEGIEEEKGSADTEVAPKDSSADGSDYFLEQLQNFG